MKLIARSSILVGMIALASCGSAPEEAAAPAPEAAAPVSTTWTLDTTDSRVAFASIKAGEIIETHYFQGLTGSVEPTGEVEVEIPLDLVETKVDIRNERMREMFFETSSFPTATITGTVDLEAFANLAIGDRLQTFITGTLSLHGNEAPIDADVFVTRIDSARVEVASAEPVVVFLSDYNLEAGLEALRDIAALPSITASSPVTFTFVFDAEDA
ncbi:MAG: YceI family protein [Pseudomonadota bacterium]